MTELNSGKFGTHVHYIAAVARDLVKDLASGLKSSGVIRKKDVEVTHVFKVPFDALSRYAAKEIMSERTHALDLGADGLELLKAAAKSPAISKAIMIPQSSTEVPLTESSVTNREIAIVLENRLKNAKFEKPKVVVEKLGTGVWQVKIQHTHAINELPVRSRAAFEAVTKNAKRNPILAATARDNLQHTDLEFEVKE